MTASTVSRVAVPLLAFAVGVMSSVRAEAQACRRSCTAGESRDARGCCIPARKKVKRKKKRAPRSRKARRKTKKKKTTTTTTTSGTKAPERGPADTGSSDKVTDDRPGDDVRDSRIDATNPYSSTGDAGQATGEFANTVTTGTETETTQRVPDKTPDSDQPDKQSAGSEFLVTPVPAQPQSDKRSRAPQGLMIGVGVGLALGGGALHWLALANGSQFDSEYSETCPEGCFADFPDRDALLARAELQQSLGTGAYVVGGALATAGLIWLLLDRNRETATETNLSITPWTGSDTVGATAGLRF